MVEYHDHDIQKPRKSLLFFGSFFWRGKKMNVIQNKSLILSFQEIMNEETEVRCEASSMKFRE